MIGDISMADNIYIICGYTDYLRSIIIREDCCNPLQLQHFLKIFSNNILSLFQEVWNIV